MFFLKKYAKRMAAILGVAVLIMTGTFCPSAAAETIVGHETFVLGSNDISIPANSEIDYDFVVPHDGECVFCRNFGDFESVKMILYVDGVKNQSSSWQVEGVFKEGQKLMVSVINSSSTTQFISIYVSDFYGTLDAPQNVFVKGEPLSEDGTIDVELFEQVHFSFDPVEGAEYYEIYVYGDRFESLTLPSNDAWVSFTRNEGSVVSCSIYPRKENWSTTGFNFYASITEPESTPGMILPKDLERIDSEAFAGIAAKKIVFPEHIISIADNAFRGSSVEVLAGGNTYVSQYAADHGMKYVAN